RVSSDAASGESGIGVHLRRDPRRSHADPRPGNHGPVCLLASEKPPRGASRMTTMSLPLLLLLAQTQLVDIQDLTPREHRVSVFVLAAAQDVQVTAVGAEPWPDRLRTRDDA